eukprot:4156710-Prymnesium_polylepis.1
MVAQPCGGGWVLYANERGELHAACACACAFLCACGWCGVNASTSCARAVAASSLERWIWQYRGGCGVCVAGTGGWT